MTRLLLALCCCSLLAAQERPTAILWDGGDISLQEAVDLLSTDGNITSLAPGTDPSKKVLLPPMATTYWEATLAICKAFNLTILPPRRFRFFPGHRSTNDRELIQVETGPVELSARVDTGEAKPLGDNPTPQELAAWLHRKSLKHTRPQDREPELRQAQGHYLVEIIDAALATTTTHGEQHSLVGLSLRLRLEPRWRLEQLGPSLMYWQQAKAANGLPLSIAKEQSQTTRRHFWNHNTTTSRREAQQTTKRPDPTIKLLPDVPQDMRGFTMLGQATSDILKELNISLLMTPGQRRVVHFGELPITLWLQTDEMARKEGRSRGGLGIEHRNDNRLSNNLNVMVSTVGGMRLSNRGNTSNNTSDKNSRFIYLSEVTEEVYQVRITASLIAETIGNPIEIPIELP